MPVLFPIAASCLVDGCWGCPRTVVLIAHAFNPSQGYPAKTHDAAFDYAMRHFMNRTVHAGEAFGPESIFQAIARCHAERIGHGYHLFNKDYVTGKGNHTAT